MAIGCIAVSVCLVGTLVGFYFFEKGITLRWESVSEDYQNRIRLYAEAIAARVSSKWKDPPIVAEPAVVLLTAHRNGKLSDIRIWRSSENRDVDNAALEAVRKASPISGTDDSLRADVFDPMPNNSRQFVCKLDGNLPADKVSVILYRSTDWSGRRRTLQQIWDKYQDDMSRAK